MNEMSGRLKNALENLRTAYEQLQQEIEKEWEAVTHHGIAHQIENTKNGVRFTTVFDNNAFR